MRRRPPGSTRSDTLVPNTTLFRAGESDRAVAAKILVAGGKPEDPATATAAARALQPIDLERDDLRLETASQAASQVAAIPAVRAPLPAFQHRFASAPPAGPEPPCNGAALAGRIGRASSRARDCRDV